MFEQLKAFLTKDPPWGVKVTVKPQGPSVKWWMTDPNGPAFEAALAAMRQGFDRDPVGIGCGGTIGFVGPLAELFGGAPALLLGIEDPQQRPRPEREPARGRLQEADGVAGAPVREPRQAAARSGQGMTVMNPIDALFHSRRAAVRKVFIPFIPAGDPDLATTARLLPALASAGAGLIEIGFPFSDPIADGPVIQAAYTRALSRGITVEQIFETIRGVSADPALARVPLVGMVSYSLIFRRGLERFLDQAKATGFSGLIVPDLPPEESEPLAGMAAHRDLKLILLVTPTTPRDRAARIARLSTGFLYCVSVTGITGERDRLPPELLDQLRWLRTQTPLPLCVGFGVSRPEHIAMLRDAADGVIVGSALVKLLGQAGDRSTDDVIADILKLVRELVTALES